MLAKQAKVCFVALIIATLSGLMLSRSPQVCAGEKADAKQLKVKSWYCHAGFGHRRKDSSFIIGDSIYVKDHITGLCTDSNGKARATLTSKYSDGEGNVIPNLGRSGAIVDLPLSGDSTISLEILRIATPLKAVKRHVTITDHISGQQAVFELPLTLLDPSTFGAFDITLSCHPKRLNFGSVFSPGQDVYILYKISGSTEKDKKTRVRGASKIIGRKNRNTLEEFDSSVVVRETSREGEDKKFSFFVHRFTPNRSGECLFQINLEDLNSGKKATYEIPFTVVTTPDFAEEGNEDYSQTAEISKQKTGQEVR